MDSSRVIEINGVKWQRVPGVIYPNNYYKIADAIAANPSLELSLYRALIKEDLFFIVQFVLQAKAANNVFVVGACFDVMTGPRSATLDLWAREHFKSTIITKAEVIQRLMNDSEETICILSYTRPTAKAFLRAIKNVFEQSMLLKRCFPDVLYENPENEAIKWSEDDGLFLKRKSFRGEASLEAWGLIEGMPTSKHFSGRVYDDIVTLDLVKTPTMMQTVKDAFDMSVNIGSDGGWHRVLGTTYHHDDPLVYLRNKTKPDGTPFYHIRIKPATVDGSYNGAPVLVSQDRLDELRTNKRTFAAQQLLDPTPQEDQRLNPEFLIEIDPEEIPSGLFRFMAVDPAGSSIRKERRGDTWALVLVGVEPFRDEIGASNFYILDLILEEMEHEEAMKRVVSMYTKNGYVRRLGVEKVGMSSTEIHVANALLAKGRCVTVKNGGLVLLSPKGRKKDERIEQNLSWPLNNGKIFLSTAISAGYRQALKTEMEKFPWWRDDGLDAISYVYDMIKDFRFGARESNEEKDIDAKARALGRTQRLKNEWMTC